MSPEPAPMLRVCSIRCMCELLLVALGLAASCSYCFGSGSLPNLGKFSFRVLNADGTAVIGRSYFELSRSDKDRLIGRGHAYFSDGEQDVEYDTLRFRPGQAPAVLTLDHKFYNADGSLQRAMSANFVTGQASCTRYQNGVAHTDSARIAFTADSYGGSAVILPLEQYLAAGLQHFKMQAFNCVPRPRLIAVQVTVHQLARWNLYPHPTVEVDVTPDLGWMSTLVSPWLPRLRAWFDPSNNWSFAGGEFSRFFRGPRIMLVREMPEEIENADNPKVNDGGQASNNTHSDYPDGS